MVNGKKPTIHIIAGVNGSGKTTLAYEIIPNVLKENEFLNADEIARGLSPFNFEKYNIEAGKILLNRFDELVLKKKSFVIETTLTSRVVNDKIFAAKEIGYEINFVYVWLNDVSLAISRVELRKISGGHYIDSNTIRRRYFRSIENFKEFIVQIADTFIVINNSGTTPEIICEKKIKINIFNKRIWDEITN